MVFLTTVFRELARTEQKNQHFSFPVLQISKILTWLVTAFFFGVFDTPLPRTVFLMVVGVTNVALGLPSSEFSPLTCSS